MNLNARQKQDDLSFAQQAAQGYPFEPREVSLLSGGFINQNFRVKTDVGDRLLRIYPKGRASSQIHFEHELQKHLADHGCRVPRAIVDAAGSLVQTLSGVSYVWMQFVDASPLTWGEARQTSGEALCQLLHPVFEHLASFQAPFRPVRETRVFARSMPALLGLVRGAGQNYLAQEIENIFSELETWERATPLPTGAIHADIHGGNVLLDRKSGELWLIDFDDAHVGTRAIDWVLSALEFSLNDNGSLREDRYCAMLTALSSPFATEAEVAAASQIRKLLILKFAASLAVLGKKIEENYFLKMLRT